MRAPAERGADAGDERQDQQAEAGEEEDPAVAGEVRAPLDEDQRQRRTPTMAMMLHVACRPASSSSSRVIIT